MIMGRNTYDLFSTIWGEPNSEYAAAIYHMRNYVFSSTLDKVSWNNTTIVLYGHGPVGRALLENDLLDELKLWVHPVVVGRGTLLFREGLASTLDLIEPAIACWHEALEIFDRFGDPRGRRGLRARLDALGRNGLGDLADKGGVTANVASPLGNGGSPWARAGCGVSWVRS